MLRGGWIARRFHPGRPGKAQTGAVDDDALERTIGGEHLSANVADRAALRGDGNARGVRAARNRHVFVMIPQLDLDEAEPETREEQPKGNEDTDDAAFGTATVHPGVVRPSRGDWRGVSFNMGT